MHTYDSDAFLASVLQNLPLPQDSGPKTRRGKEIVASNAVTHGLRMKSGRLLPCKRKCYYKENCEWHEMIYSDNKDMYAGPCPYEVALFSKLEEKLREDCPDISDELLLEYIHPTIAINRCNRFIGIHPEIKGSVRGYNYVHIVKAQHEQKWLKATKKLREKEYEDSE